MWWQGLYMYKALLATVGNLFLEEGAEPNQYPNAPLLEEAETEKAEERKKEKQEEEEEQERMKLVAYLNQVMMARQ